MMELYGIYHCQGIEIGDRRSIPDIECEQYHGRQIDNVISVEDSAENLGLMLLPRGDGWFMPDVATITDKLDMGANNSLKVEQPEAYWSEVTETIKAFSQLSSILIDLLLLTGDHVIDAQFLVVVDQVFESNKYIRKEEYLRQPADHVFATSRAAAEEARYGVMANWEACLWPDSCPGGEEKLR